MEATTAASFSLCRGFPAPVVRQAKGWWPRQVLHLVAQLRTVGSWESRVLMDVTPVPQLTPNSRLVFSQ